MSLKVACGGKNFIASRAGDLLLLSVVVVYVISQSNGLTVAFRAELASKASFTVVNVANVHLQSFVQAVAFTAEARKRLQSRVLVLQVDLQAHS